MSKKAKVVINTEFDLALLKAGLSLTDRIASLKLFQKFNQLPMTGEFDKKNSREIK